MNGKLQWVKPDVDYPKDCPRCYLAPAMRPRRGHGPRRTLRCTRCSVRWKPGTRIYRPRHIQRIMTRLAYQGITCETPMRGW